MNHQKVGWRVAVVAIVTLIAVIWSVPNFVDTSKFWWPTNNRMVMGLDIQGGLHLVLRVDIAGALKQEITRMAGTMREEFAKDKIAVESVTADTAEGTGRIIIAKPTDPEAVARKLTALYGNQLATSTSGGDTIAEFTELHVREFKKGTVERSIETIRNRIDEFGVAEPSITAQGDDRILVQLPGIQDATNAKDLINKTARLDFMIVNENFPNPNPGHTREGAAANQAAWEKLVADAEKSANIKLGKDLKFTDYNEKINAALKGKIPEGNIVRFEKAPNAETMEAGRIPYVLIATETVPGDLLTDAFVAPGEGGRPVVSFRLDGIGGQRFGEMSGKHIKERMAIVLDGIVKSAPTLQSKITNSGQITLGARTYQETLNEAKTLSITLKSGALPAALEQLEERTVGPTVGADAIQKGRTGAMVAAGLVFLFMFLYYRTAGLIANFALALNLLLTIAALSAFGASLTLPGIAGLALGLGIAVDASVLVYERIKEELRHGVSMNSAIGLGYDKAFSSIFDANVTSIMVCIVLMYYGTGSIRGFAITLLTGLVITLFTAVFCTRVIYDVMVGRLKHIPAIQW